MSKSLEILSRRESKPFLPIRGRSLTYEGTDIVRRWMFVSLFSLFLSGFFSLVIVLARTPGVSSLISDPNFAKKALVIHVDLALVVWLMSFLAVLFVAMHPVRIVMNTFGMRLAIFGVLCFCSTLFIPDASPILANYIPVLDHEVFLLGLFLFGLGLIISFFQIFLGEGDIVGKHSRAFGSSGAQISITFAAYTVCVAVVTLFISWIITPVSETQILFYERMMWGGGHLLQFANVFGMITAWQILLKKIVPEDLLPDRIHRILLGFLLIPVLISPILVFADTSTTLYFQGFTQLMRWGIFPVVSIYILLGLRHVISGIKTRKISLKSLHSVSFYGWSVSVVLTIIGFVLGALIRSSNTLIPAHYHASLGGVTVSYMAVMLLLFDFISKTTSSLRRIKYATWQPLIFGVGQTLFVMGFAYAGMHGMGRKMFGTDQKIHSIETLIGLGFMSVGGLLAMIGGLLFIGLILKYLYTQYLQNYGTGTTYKTTKVDG